MVRGYLTDTTGALVATGVAEHLKIHPGTNSIDVVFSQNEAVAQLLGASDNINVSDNVVVKGATLTLKTGLTEGTQGISRVDVQITGKAYGDGQETALIASLDAPAIEDYQWLPRNSSANYLPGKLASNNAKTPFTIISQAIDPFGTVVGTQTLALSILGTAFVDVNVDPSSKTSAGSAAAPTP